ncbi:MAG: aminotransferase class V-fold PLP-dependent enzyme [Bacteroidales bacterium]|nr:aminotransferase class V-fold PLP-dependent enzyme [Bacteroidales bacterium]
MILFRCDYAEGAHPEILRRLTETNFEQLDGYGSDPYCESAKRKILAACACPEGEVHFLVGGTQTNSTVIAALLRDYEGAVAVETGHIGVHEAGAVEYTGHKVLTLPQHQGKMAAADLEAYLAAMDADVNKDHMVWPGLVYISLSTEYGTIYSRAELAELQSIAHKYGLPLFVDGARLGYALASPACDYTLADLAKLCDVFYIGGTKVGALCGEAVVFPKQAPKHFFTTIKQHGALLAKGRLLGIQFDTLFTDNLYGRIAQNAIDRARDMIAVLKEKGIPFFLESPTNQQFVILENGYMDRLAQEVGFDIWQPYDADHTVVRFATSWATTPEQIEQLRELL